MRKKKKKASRKKEPMHRIFPGIPDKLESAASNTAALNQSLHELNPGETLVVPKKVYHILGGVEGVGLRDATIRIDGTLLFSPNTEQWPHHNDGTHRAGLAFWDAQGLTLTSSGTGILDGNGRAWWSLPGIGYLIHQENRPRLLTIANSSSVLVERLLLKDSPYWTTLIVGVDGLTIRHCGISARRTPALSHSLIDLSAFNTDGFDMAGCRRVWVHDCDIWTQDDAIAVKDHILLPSVGASSNSSAYLAGVRHGASHEDGEEEVVHPLATVIPSEDMLFERINASGLGLTIGSIGDGIVRNITFRDCYLKNTVKGLYLKFRRGKNATGSLGRIQDVTYQNIWMDRPSQWPIWIGPAQQADASNPCFANPCSLCWPMLPGAQCSGSLTGQYERITLRNVHVFAPHQSPGVVLGAVGLPMRGVVFDSVVVHTACGAASPFARGGFPSAFPRLPTAVAPDPAVPALYVLVGVGASAAVGGVLVFWARAGASVRRRLRWGAALLLGLLALLLARVAAVSARLQDTSQYYSCEGVEGGVATGATWPVPPCFVDRTTHAPHSSRCLEGGWWARTPVQLGLLAGVAACASAGCLARLRAARRLVARGAPSMSSSSSFVELQRSPAGPMDEF